MKKKWFYPIFFKSKENNVTNIVQWLPHNFQMLRHTFLKFIAVNWTETIVQLQIYLLHYSNSVLFQEE